MTFKTQNINKTNVKGQSLLIKSLVLFTSFGVEQRAKEHPVQI